jgi:hypothetical protein
LTSTRKHGLVLDLGMHGRGHTDLENAVGDRLASTPSWMSTAGLLLLQQDGRGIGLLQRHLLEVNALNLENGVFVCHKTLSRLKQPGPPESHPPCG